MLSNESVGRAPIPDRGAIVQGAILVCRTCRMEATHNKTLRLSYCPIHGFDSALDYRVTSFRQAPS